VRRSVSFRPGSYQVVLRCDAKNETRLQVIVPFFEMLMITVKKLWKYGPRVHSILQSCVNNNHKEDALQVPRSTGFDTERNDGALWVMSTPGCTWGR
jgi:hypothetical protein